MEAAAFTVVPALAASRASLPGSARLAGTRPALGRGSAQRRAGAAGLAASRCTRTASARGPVLRTRAQSESQSSGEPEKTPFGYTRKDVIVIGVGLTAFGFGLRYGLEYGLGLDGLQAGNITELVVVVGLCVGYISTYLWRVGNKEMTYAKQLRDYEQAVMEKRLEKMSETELEAMLAEVEEEKQRLRAKQAGGRQE